MFAGDTQRPAQSISTSHDIRFAEFQAEASQLQASGKFQFVELVLSLRRFEILRDRPRKDLLQQFSAASHLPQYPSRLDKSLKADSANANSGSRCSHFA